MKHQGVINTNQNSQIDGLKGISSLMIVTFHLICRYSQIYLQKDIPFINLWGSLGVCIFLLISVYYNLSGTGGGSRQVLKRVLRLWPSYIAGITLTKLVLFFIPIPERTCSFKDYLLNIFFVNGFIGTAYVDGAHWYITTLITIIIFFSIFKYFKIHQQPLTYMIWMMIAFIFGYLLEIELISNAIGGVHVGVICIGALSNVNSKNKQNKIKYILWIIVFVLALCFTYVMSGKRYFFCLILAMPIVSLALLGKITILGNQVFRFISMVSYPLYIIHQNIGFAIEYKLTEIFGDYSYSFALIAFIIVYTIALCLYYLIEKPAQWFIKNWLFNSIETQNTNI